MSDTIKVAAPSARGLSPVPLEAMENQVRVASGNSAYENPHTLRITNSPSPLRNSNTRNEPASNLSPSLPGPLPETQSDEKNDKVTWGSLPNKPQLALLTLARLSEPITQTSLQSYIYHQLASFEPDAHPATIAVRVGFVVAAFSAAQTVSSIFWGISADHPSIGRKRVIVIGLLGTAFGSIGYGLSLSWQTAVFWRAFSGLLNGNVGVMRTMISEMIREKKYQSRAFLLMPMCFNIGTVIGPTLGGWLADPVETYPAIFGPGSFIGGSDGVQWLQRWPYALPNFVSAIFLFSAACWLILGLDETLEARRDRPDLGRDLGRAIARSLSRIFSKKTSSYSQINGAEPDTPGFQDFSSVSPETHKKRPKSPNKLPFNRIWTSNVLANLLSRCLLSVTVSSFQILWATFLSAPRHPNNTSLFQFSGGLGLPPVKVGNAMAILGGIGITLQLTCYPIISDRLETTRLFRYFLPLFPLASLAVPFLARLPSTSPAPEPISGPIVWICICSILFTYVVARTFVMPASITLVNNCAPHPSRLSTTHGIAQSIGSGGRSLGPVVGGAIYGAGEAMGVVGLAWWVLAAVGGVSCLASLFVREGSSGHEILMPGEVRRGKEVVYIGDGEEEEDDIREDRR